VITIQNEYTNIYQAARKAAGFTQERAAELLGLSVESIKAYEGDVTIPKNTVVKNMVDVYGASFLAVQHLRASTDLARDIIPDIKETDLSTAVIRLLNRIRIFANQHRTDRLLEIADDGKIDMLEREDYKAILSELDEIVRSALELKYIREVE